MSDLIQQHAAAKIAFEEARAALEIARRNFEEGPGKKFAEVKQSALAVQQAIREHEQASQTAKVSLADALRAAAGEITQQAKDALAQRRNAEDLLDQYRELAVELESATTEAQILASQAARVYIGAYDTAARCWAELNVRAVLLECGERMARAMAVQRTGASAADGLGVGNSTCRDMMIDVLDRLSAKYSDDQRPFVNDIGVVDLGSMTAGEILSAGAVNSLRVQKGSVAAMARSA